MELLKLILDFVTKIAWPVLLLVFFIVFRKEVRKILSSLQRLRYQNLEIDFTNIKEQAKEIRSGHKETLYSQDQIPIKEQAFKVAATSPLASIMLSWSILESEISKTVARLAISPDAPSSRSIVHNIEMLSQHPNILKNTIDSIHELRKIRNKIAHGVDQYLTENEALSYADVSLSLVNTLIGITRND